MAAAIAVACAVVMLLAGATPAWAVTNVSYIDENGVEQVYQGDIVEVTSSNTSWDTGWYVVNDDVTISDRIAVTGDVHLILANGYTLRANRGIDVDEGNSLTIYGQSVGSGALIATTALSSDVSASAGIGGKYNKSGGTITINGGNITAIGSTNGAGIGGGRYGSGGIIAINGGTVTAINNNSPAGGGAAIGGGQQGGAGAITINGGTVTATAYRSATISGCTALGGGIFGTGGSVTITGGIVTATGDGDGAGIGHGPYGGNVTFSTMDGEGNPGTAVIYATGGASGQPIAATYNEDDLCGIIFQGNSGQVYGDQTLTGDVTIDVAQSLVIPSDTTLTIPEGVTLTNDGVILCYGTLDDSRGTLAGSGIVKYPATVTVGPSSAAYGDSVTLTVTVKTRDGANVTDGTVTFYQGTDTSGTPLNGNGATVSNGTVTYTIDNLTWTPNTTPYTITAVYEPADAGSNVLRGGGQGTLSVSKATPTATPVGPISSSNRSETSVTLNTVSDSGTGTYGPIQYGYTTGEDTAPDVWQDSNQFTDLQPGTDYTFYIRYKGNDFYSPSSPGSNTLVITTNPKITTENLSAGHVGVAYEEKLAATVANGKTVTWKPANGSTLPSGLTLNSDGTITGTPTTAGTFKFTVQASISGAGGTMVSNAKELSIIINAGTPDITATTYKGESQTDTFSYGDTITVGGKIAASTTAPGTSTNAIVQNRVGLYLGDTELATASVENDDSFTLTYDTSKKGITSSATAQTLTVKYGGSSDLNSGETTVSITLKKKSVTAQVQGDITKIYDGNTSATVNLAVASGDLVNSTDTVTVTGTGTYQSAEVGSNVPVTVSNVQTGGTDADWYSVSAPTGVTGSITQSGSSLAVDPSSTSLAYGDTLTLTVKPSTTGMEPAQNALLAGLRGLVDLLTGANSDTVELYNDDKLLAGTSEKNEDGSYTLTYSTADKGLSVGDNTLTVKFNGDNNMAASGTNVTVTLSKKNVAASVSGTLNKTYDGATNVTVNLAFDGGVLVGSDSFTGTVAGSFSDANAGTDKAVALTGELTWSDEDIAKFYDITLPSDVTGTINPQNIEQQPVTIAGNAVFGEVLKAEYAQISGEEVTYQWTRDGANIDGATGKTYQVGVDDIGKAIAVTVTPTDSNHAGSATSSTVTPTARALNVTGVTAKPDTGATTTTDVTLTASLGNGVSELVPPGAVQFFYVAADAAEGAESKIIGAAEVKADAEGNLSASLAWNNAPAGTWKIVAAYAPAGTDGYAAGATGTLASFNVSKTDQTGFEFTGDGVEQGAGGAFTLRTTYAPDATIKLQTTGGQGSGNVTFAVTSGTGVLELAEDGQTVRVLKSGAAVVTATKAADDTYNATTATLTVTVDRAEGRVKITTATLDKTYDSKVAEVPEYEVMSDGDVAVTWYRLDGDNATQLKEAPADAGTYRVAVSATETDCYTAASDSMTFKIAPASLAGAVKVAGSATYGETLVASYDGSADAGNAAVSWQWLRDDEAIDGATDATYTVASQDVGRELSVRVAATDANHAGSVTSKTVRAETRSLNVATITAQPSGSAEAAGNVELTATLANAVGSDVPAGTVRFSVVAADADEGTEPEVIGSAQVERADDGALTASVAWERVPAGSWNVTAAYVPAEGDCYAAGAAATFENYDIAKTEQDALMFDVEGAKDGRLDLIFSPNTTVELVVAGGSGTGAVAYALTGGDDVLDLDGATVTVRHAGTATITATKAGDADYNATTAVLTVTVVPAELGGAVAVAGDAVVGETLTAAYDGPAAAVAWQWLRDGKEIAGATGESYTLGADDVGCALTARATSVDGDYAGSVESATTGKVAKAVQAAPTGLMGLAESVAGSDDGRITGLVPALTYEISCDDGETWVAPRLSEDGTAAVGLAAGTYLVRLAETATHAASDTVQVTVPSFSAAHGGISYPDGSTAGDDGTVTLPEEGGTVTFPGDVEIGLPGGSVVSPDKPAATLPEGGGAVTFPDGSQVMLPGGTVVDPERPAATLPEAGGSVTFPDGTKVALPGGSVVDGSSATAPDGTVVRPDGEGGLVVTLPDGTELAAPSGSTIGADGTVTDPDGNPVEPDVPGDDEPTDDGKPGDDGSDDDKPTDDAPGDDEPAEDEPAGDNEPAGDQQPTADKGAGDEPAAPQDDVSRADGGALATTGDVAPLAALIACAAGAALLALGVIARKRKR